MLDFIKGFFASTKIKQLDNTIKVYADKLSTSTIIIDSLQTQIHSLENTLAKIKVNKATVIDKLSVTAHAVHRYRERHNDKGSDEEIYTMLYKALIKETQKLDTLPDGIYTLRKGVAYQVINFTLVTVLPGRASRPQQKFKRK